ncbi:U3 small nucleolar RNA-associated protein [Paracoccidioides lutzii Pb01]|uniref:U3 small nucleolar RNA-associated protein n=1 Tax=Paracoccidioides lutzii (strain ATCC MYA-826 / Pb01) TaxID=502779 RepID=C1GWZ3_PARBA|nr:U3 small nucleolar RNA-associated protein [Paracoccidioides lutzii Pb01]EEH41081.2 U3 small nucleolar RNA-associated protein [Paracoccidioides lutzii Pb01]
MAAPVLPLPQVKLPSIPSTRLTPEQQYWRSFKNPLLLPSPSNSPINHISQPSTSSVPSSSTSSFATSTTFNTTTPPDLFTVTTGSRVQLHSIRTRKLLKTLTRFDDIARCADIRADGRILAASDDSGTIQLFDINMLVSAGDDRVVRLWDLPSGEDRRRKHRAWGLREMCGVYARGGSGDQLFGGGGGGDGGGGGGGGNLLFSAGYDGMVKIWDSRATGRSVMTFQMRGAVESVLPLLSGTMVLASAENRIAVLDVVAGKPLHIIKSHQKTVTALSLASGGRRVVSGALDGHMKVFETTGWNVVGGSKYPSPILSLGVITTGHDREDKHIAVGMQSGLLSIRTRLSGAQKIRERERAREMQALLDGKLDEHDKRVTKLQKKKHGRGWEKRLRGMDFIGEGVDIVIDAQDPASASHKRKREQPWELDLRKGRYAAALDAVLCPSSKSTGANNKLNILTLLTALRHRSALRVALSGRDEVTLQPILQWVYKSITDPRVVDICVEVAMNVLDIYSGNLGQSVVFDGLVERLHVRVREEVDRAQQAWMTKGMLGMLRVGA